VTSTGGFLAQISLLVRQGIKAELSDRERIVSPLLFAATIMVLFAFTMGDVEKELRDRIFLAQTFLTLFLALQISFARTFEPDAQDRVFDMLRTYPVSSEAWFLSRVVLVFLNGVAILFPTVLLGGLLWSQDASRLLTWQMFLIAFLTLFGLCALGVLLSAMTLRALARQIIFPLLYFPLTAPVLLAAVQAAGLALAPDADADTFRGWLTLLTGFGVIYFTLGLLLFGELVEPS
jgi:ABC-type transport system involved in cytochrome c biogenesis permease component